MTADDDPMAVLTELIKRLEAARHCSIGFPGALDYPHPQDPEAALLLARLLTTPLNNVGDPFVAGVYQLHSKALEVEVIQFLATLLRAPQGHWGHITSSGTAATRTALRMARSQFPDAVVYQFASAHPSVPDAVDLLGLRSVVCRVRAPRDQADYADLKDQVASRRHRPAIVVATAGTTITEAIDDVRHIKQALGELGVPHFIHVDAALSGIPLALLPLGERPSFDFTAGADTLSVSGHKFLGVPEVSAALLARPGLTAGVTRTAADYTGTPLSAGDTSRSGHAPLLWWWAIRHWGLSGLRERAATARGLALSTQDRLRREVGWSCFVNPHAMTVVLLDPVPEAVAARWSLAVTSDGRSHLITMPGVTGQRLGEFIADLARTRLGPQPPRSLEDPR